MWDEGVRRWICQCFSVARCQIYVYCIVRMEQHKLCSYRFAPLTASQRGGCSYYFPQLIPSPIAESIVDGAAKDAHNATTSPEVPHPHKEIIQNQSHFNKNRPAEMDGIGTLRANNIAQIQKVAAPNMCRTLSRSGLVGQINQLD